MAVVCAIVVCVAATVCGAPNSVSVGGAPNSVSVGGAPNSVSAGGAPNSVSVGGAPNSVSVMALTPGTRESYILNYSRFDRLPAVEMVATMLTDRARAVATARTTMTVLSDVRA